MAKDSFQFKQFTIRHGKCAMKVGTDGVLLGAWANIQACHQILDVGTGSGLIALMLAQRCPEAKITAIDIDADACAQAVENASLSPFSDRIRIGHHALSEFREKANLKYDLIVSNPPYFIDALQSPDPQRTTARHAHTLSVQSLLHDCRKILAPNGRIALILPYDQQNNLYESGKKENYCVIRETDVIPKPGGIPKRILVELSMQSTAHVNHSQLLIEIERHLYSEEYIRLTRDFYLKM